MSSIAGTCGGPWSWPRVAKAASAQSARRMRLMPVVHEIIAEGWHRSYGGPHAEIDGAEHGGRPRGGHSPCMSRLNPVAILEKRLPAPLP